MKKILFTLLLHGLLLSCSSQSSKEKGGRKEPVASSITNEKKQNTQAKPDVMKLIRHQVVDRQGTGLVAANYLLPEGWTAQDQLYWEYRDPTVPIRYKALFQSPEKGMQMQTFADVRASWYTGPSGTQGYRPPSDIVTGLKDLVKAERKDKAYRFVDEKILGNNPQSGYQQGSQYSTLSQTGMVKIAYDENGESIEEEFYGQLDVTSANTPSAMGAMQSIIWGASNLFAVKAPAGKLNECRKIAQTLKSSMQLTLPFYNKLAQVIQLLSNQVYQQIYQAGQISRIISQTNDQMIANIDASYRQTQQVNDRINNQFSDYMRGVDRYNNGTEQIQLPSGYDHAWVNDRGEYILTNTAGWDPGTTFNGNWKPLQRDH